MVMGYQEEEYNMQTKQEDDSEEMQKKRREEKRLIKRVLVLESVSWAENIVEESSFEKRWGLMMILSIFSSTSPTR